MADVLEQLTAALADRYAVERELGRGGMATVYLAQDLKHHRPVAIKVLKPELAAALGPDRFLREIEVTAGLHHPHILPLFDSGRTGGQAVRRSVESAGLLTAQPPDRLPDFLFYVMPFVEGESLRDRLERERQLPLEEALQLTREVAEALSYAHSRGVIHRDIKPENILLEGGHALVADFGIAKAVTAAGGERLTTTGISIGTPAYMSPEQASGTDHLDGRSDLYSLGCVLYEMLAGHPPFTGTTAHELLARHATDPVPPLRTGRATIPEPIEAAVERALAKVPADRFATAQQFSTALQIDATAYRKRQRTLTAVRRLAIGVAGAVVVAGAVYGTLRYRAATSWKRVDLDPNAVAILPFEVRATDPQLATLDEGIIDFLYPILSGDAGPRAIEPNPFLLAIADRKARGQWASADAPLRLAAHFRASQVLEGRVAQAGTQLTLNAWLRRVPDGATLARGTVSGSADSLYALIPRLAVELLGSQLGESAERVAALVGRPLPSLRAYLAGAQAVRAGRYLEAQELFRQATAADSTFGLAALRAAELWRFVQVGATVEQRDLRVVQAHRASLGSRDQAALEVLIAQGEPCVSADIVSAVRAWVAAAPHDPAAWLDLALYTAGVGRLIPIPDWKAIARNAFEHAWQLDSVTAPLVTLHVANATSVGDVEWLRRVGPRYLTVIDSTADTWLSARWSIAEALADSVTIRALQSRLLAGDDHGEGWSILRRWASRSMPPPVRDSVIHVLLSRPMSPLDSTAMFHHIDFYSLETGRLHEAIQLHDRLRHGVRAMGDSTWRRIQVLGWSLVHPGLDSVVDALMPALVRTRDQHPGDYQVACHVLLHRAWRGDTTGVRSAVHALRVPEERLGICTAMVDALLEAYDTRRNDTPALDRLEQLLRLGPTSERPSHIGMALVAQLRRARGQYELGLAAARARFPIWAHYRHQRVPMLRQEGDLASLLGDTAGAVRAYTEYLSFRVDPDPGAMQAEVDSVRAALDALLRAKG